MLSVDFGLLTTLADFQRLQQSTVRNQQSTQSLPRSQGIDCTASPRMAIHIAEDSGRHPIGQADANAEQTTKEVHVISFRLHEKFFCC
jgi:hypothetical protein